MAKWSNRRRQSIIKRGLLIAGFLFILFFMYVLYAANQGSLPLFIRRFYMFPGGDKAGHTFLLALLTFFSNHLLRSKTLEIGGNRWLLGSIIIFLFITVEEFSQVFIASRTFDLGDLFSSYLGIFLGNIAARYFDRIYKSENKNSPKNQEANK